jgi:hypothetical protein
LALTDSAQGQFEVALESGEIGTSALRVFIDHRCRFGHGMMD